MLILVVNSVDVKEGSKIVNSLFAQKLNNKFFAKENRGVDKNVASHHFAKLFCDVIKIHATLHEIEEKLLQPKQI